MSPLRSVAARAISLLRRVDPRAGAETARKLPLVALEQQLSALRRRSEVLAICPTPTGGNWRGVLTATLGLFPDSTFQIPQYYSQSVYTERELRRLSETIRGLAFSKVVFSGYPTYFRRMVDALDAHTNLYLVYHGSLSSNREDRSTIALLEEILSLQRRHQLKRLGFVKKGMAESLGVISGVDASHVRLPTRLPDGIETGGFAPGYRHIGVFASADYRKNLDNQIVAGLMVAGAVVHARKDYGFGYLFSDARLVYHPFVDDHAAFLGLLGSMDVNLYVSFSECFGQVVTESMAMGVPCLAADNSGIFDFDDSLRDLLVVREFDDSRAIYDRVEQVLGTAASLGPRLRAYVELLNRKASESLERFLRD